MLQTIKTVGKESSVVSATSAANKPKNRYMNILACMLRCSLHLLSAYFQLALYCYAQCLSRGIRREPSKGVASGLEVEMQLHIA